MAIIEIKTLTPVHVGSGRFLMSKSEYVSGGESYGVVDEAKVLSLLGDDRIDAWVRSIEKGESLVGLLKTFDIKPKLNEISSRKIKIECNKDRAKNLPNLKEHIHNGQGLAYLPGSSIKGAIRSAIFNQMIREKGEQVPDDKLKQNYGKYSASGLEKGLFGNDPNHDIFRFLRIGDAYFPKNSTVALIMDNLNLKGNPESPEALYDESKNQLLEAIGKEVKTSFQIRFDETGMNRNLEYRTIQSFPDSFSGIDSLFELINSNTIQILQEELEFWSNYDSDDADEYLDQLKIIQTETVKCQTGECVLRMAHGSGWTFITGNWVNQQTYTDDDSYHSIVDVARPGNQRKYADYPFPKSRRISSELDLLGFVKLKKVIL